MSGAKGARVRLDQVAVVKEDHQPLAGDAIINDGPGLLLVVEKLPWGDTLEVTKGVDEAIRSLQPGLPNITFDTTIFRQANFIRTSIHNLTQALLLGFLLVLVILVGFLFEPGRPKHGYVGIYGLSPLTKELAAALTWARQPYPKRQSTT